MLKVGFEYSLVEYNSAQIKLETDKQVMSFYNELTNDQILANDIWEEIQGGGGLGGANGSVSSCYSCHTSGKDYLSSITW